MLTALEYLGAVGKGVTSPQYFRANDAHLYVVKLANNILGLKVLVNEFLGAQWGRVLRLPFPHSDIIHIEKEKIQFIDRNQEYMAIQSEVHFASRYLEDTEYVYRHNYNIAENMRQMAGVILFDHLFLNPDRTYNYKNLLLRKEESNYRIYAIDNSHLFGSGRWTASAIKMLADRMKIYDRHIYGLYLKNILFADDFLPYIERLEKMSVAAIEQMVEEVPKCWLSIDERDDLTKVMIMRIGMTEIIWQNLCKYIPPERGGTRFLLKKIYRLHKKRTIS